MFVSDAFRFWYSIGAAGTRDIEDATKGIIVTHDYRVLDTMSGLFPQEVLVRDMIPELDYD